MSDTYLVNIVVKLLLSCNLWGGKACQMDKMLGFAVVLRLGVVYCEVCPLKCDEIRTEHWITQVPLYMFAYCTVCPQSQCD